jgi:hypothetical protein
MLLSLMEFMSQLKRFPADGLYTGHHSYILPRRFFCNSSDSFNCRALPTSSPTMYETNNRKRGDAGKWLEFFVAANKWYVKASTDKGRARGWLRLGSDPAARPELSTGLCEIWDGERWTTQTTITILSAKKRREEDRRIGTERKALSVPVDVRGALGPSASSINGVYEPTDEICGGWPVYRKQGDGEKWLEHHASTNEWYVKPTADRNRAEGWMCLASDPPCRPELCRGMCEVWNGERWSVADSVTVLVAGLRFNSPAELEAFCASETQQLNEKIRAAISHSATRLGTESTDDEEQCRSALLGGF